MADIETRLPVGAADWNPPTDDEIDRDSEITSEVVDDAKRRASEIGGKLDAMLNAREANG